TKYRRSICTRSNISIQKIDIFKCLKVSRMKLDKLRKKGYNNIVKLRKNKKKGVFMKFFNNNGDTKVFALGGLGEVGKNMYCIMHDNEIIIMDSGVTFPQEDLRGVD